MLRLFLKNNILKNKNKTIENFYETRDFIIKNVNPKIKNYKNYKNYYETEAFKQYKPNLKK